MMNVEPITGALGYGDRTPDRLRLDECWARVQMRPWIRATECTQLALEPLQYGIVFRVDANHEPQPSGLPKCAVDHTVIGARVVARRLAHKQLEAHRAFRGHRRQLGFVVGQNDSVQPKVHVGVFRRGGYFFAEQRPGGRGRSGIGHLVHRGNSADGRRLCSAAKVFLVGESRLTEVDVDVDQARQHMQAGAVYAATRLQAVADGGHFAILHGQIAAVLTGPCNDGGAVNHQVVLGHRKMASGNIAETVQFGALTAWLILRSHTTLHNTYACSALSPYPVIKKPIIARTASRALHLRSGPTPIVPCQGPAAVASE